MVQEEVLSELRNQSNKSLKASGRRPPRSIEVDPRVMVSLLDEVENHRAVLLIAERQTLTSTLRG